MGITLIVKVSGKKATATAVVSPLQVIEKGGVVKPTVKFELENVVSGGKKVLDLVKTDEDGRIDLSLGKIDVGSYTVKATVLGRRDGFGMGNEETDSTTFEIVDKPKDPAGPLGIAMMIVFWLMMILISWGIDTLPLIISYLAITAVVLKVITQIKGTTLGSMLGNNNWVFWANTAMLVVSTIMAFVGESWMWSDMAILHTIAFIPSIFVSFTDEMKDLVTGQVKKHGVGGFLKHVVSWEILTEAVKIPFKLGK